MKAFDFLVRLLARLCGVQLESCTVVRRRGDQMARLILGPPEYVSALKKALEERDKLRLAEAQTEAKTSGLKSRRRKA